MQRLRNERGAVGVVVALLMIPLMGFAAIAIDVSALYAERQQLQNGADAAALAIAQDCASGSCGKAEVTAQNFAAANLRNDTSTATVTALTSTSVTVRNSGVRNNLFAPVLGTKSTTINVTASAEWAGPTAGTSNIPLTINQCEFDAATGGGVPSTTTQRTILLSRATGSTCFNFLSLTPGGFAWVAVNSGSCGRTSAITGTLSRLPANVSSSNGPPSSCSSADLVKLQNTTVLVPIFDSYSGIGSAASYHVYGYAAFKITGYYFGAQFNWGSPCSGTDRCIRGYFTKKTDRVSTFTYGSGAVQLGAGVITLTE